MTRLAGCRSHGEPWPAHSPASAAPPAPMGAGAQSADAPASNIGGGDAGFTYPPRLRRYDRDCWSALVTPACAEPQDIGELLELLEASGEARAAAQLQALKRARLILQRVSTDAPTGTRVSLPAADLLVLTRYALQRLR